MKLPLIAADPMPEVAQLIIDQCRPLAEPRIAAVTADDVMLAASELHPEIVILSLELVRFQPEEFVKKIRQILPDALLMATFRELTLPQMEESRRAGVDEFIPQPVDPVHIFQAASLRFGTPVRRHERFTVTLDVFRSDGEPLGRTTNISEGGMCLDALCPLKQGDSFPVCLSIPPAPQTLVGVRFRVVAVEATQPTRVHGGFENIRGESHRRLARFLSQLGQTPSG